MNKECIVEPVWFKGILSSFYLVGHKECAILVYNVFDKNEIKEKNTQSVEFLAHFTEEGFTVNSKFDESFVVVVVAHYHAYHTVLYVLCPYIQKTNTTEG